MEINEAKQICWDRLNKGANNVKVNKCRNCSQANKNSMYADYNYNNVLSALVLKEKGWKLRRNEDIYAVDLLGIDPEGNEVEVECKIEWFPSNNFFFEVIDENGHHKDYWTDAKDKQVYFAGVCPKTKTLNLYDITEFRKLNNQNQKFGLVDSRHGTTGFLIGRTEPYAFKKARYDLGV